MVSAAAPMYHTVSVGPQIACERHEARNHMGERETLEACVHKIARTDRRCCSPDRGRSARVSPLVMLMRHHRGRLLALSRQLSALARRRREWRPQKTPPALDERYCLTRPVPPSTVRPLPTSNSRLARTTGQRRCSHAPLFCSHGSARSPATRRTMMIAKSGSTYATL